MELPQVGSTFEGKYAIRQTLGEGGFAVVYHASDLEIQRDVAIKILTPRDGEYPKKVVARFMREARVIASLQDPHTIKLYEFGESAQGLLYMVFQFVSGLDLQTVIRRRGALPPEVAVHVIAQVLSALTEAHAAGVLHRDIKPANILVHEYMGDEFSVKLLDFGIAKTDENHQVGGSLTKTGALIGTPKYMAPEQVFGEKLGPPSDIYSLGLVAFEALVGEAAIRGSKEEMLRAHVSEDPILLPYDVGWLSLRQVVERMLAREPEDRFQTAQDAHKALRYAMKHRHAGLPSGVVPAPSSISGPIPPLPYSSGLQAAPGAFSSGHYTPPADFSSGMNAYVSSSTHSSDALSAERSTSGASVIEDPPKQSKAILIAGVLAVVVMAVAAFMARPEPPTAPPVERAVPNALLNVPSEPTASQTEPATATADLGLVDAGDPAIDPELVPRGNGCGNQYSWQYERWIQIESAASRRPVQVFLPKDYRPQHRYPVIIALQPANWDVKQYVKRAQLDVLALAQKAIVLGPAPVDRYEPWTAVDDVAILRSVVARAAEQFCLDLSRVYVVGTGAGGHMARELACQIPLSGVATTGDGELASHPSCEPKPPVPFLRIIGKQDHFAPIAGGLGCNGGEFLTAKEHDHLWRVRNDCTDKRTQWLDAGGSQCWSWECADATYASCHAAGGHYLKETRWDVLDPSECEAPTLRLPVGPTAWQFFEEHGRHLDVPESQ